MSDDTAEELRYASEQKVVPSQHEEGQPVLLPFLLFRGYPLCLNSILSSYPQEPNSSCKATRGILKES